VVYELEKSVYKQNKLRARRPGFNSQRGKDFFLFSTASKLPLELTQPPVQWVLDTEADHSHLSGAEIKNGKGKVVPVIR